MQQLHAWVHTNDFGLALFRQAQLKALALPAVGLSTAFDAGDPRSAEPPPAGSGSPGGTVHPYLKHIPGRRLAATYAGRFLGLPVPYLHPTYAGATAWAAPVNATHTFFSVAIAFDDETVGAGLELRAFDPASNSSHCPVERSINASLCDWFAIQADDANSTWHHATVALTADGRGLNLTAVVAGAGLAPVATKNGYSDWPVVTAYNKAGFPVLTWSKPITG